MDNQRARGTWCLGWLGCVALVGLWAVGCQPTGGIQPPPLPPATPHGPVVARPTPVQKSFTGYREAKFEVQVRQGQVYALGNVVSDLGVPGLKALRMDLYQPAGHDAMDKPAVVMIDAGGEAKLEGLARFLTARGFVCFTAQVRRSEDRPPQPERAAVVDARAALRWAHAHAKALGVGETRIAVLGRGSGGSVALATAITDPETFVKDEPAGFDRHSPHPYNSLEASAWVRAAVNVGGAGRLLESLDSDDPPLLLVDGAGGAATVGELDAIAQRAKQFSAQCELLRVAGGDGSGWDAPADGATLADRILDFLVRRMVEDHTYFYEQRVEPSRRGTVTRSPGGGYYRDRQRVTLAAEPAPGYRFLEWTGDVKDWRPRLDVTIDKLTSVAPQFIELRPQEFYNLEAHVQGQGRVLFAPPGGHYVKNSWVRLYKLPEAGWRHQVILPAITSYLPYMDLFVDRNSEITVVFERIDAPGAFTLETAMEGQGQLTLDPPGGQYPDGTVVTVTAEPPVGQAFAWWAGDTRETGPRAVVVMNANKRLTAGFEPVANQIP